ncbi:MAG: VOC family protein [Deltaproteobacteria bacterium]|nr:VOC family protein [Deltaproteobacteria bacterium]
MLARFTHVNLVAEDWRRLAAFYERALGCTPIPPERDYSGEWLERITGVPAPHIRGVHLQLPGHDEGGPTLEIFQYEPSAARPEIRANTPGFCHIAFAVADPAEAAERVFAEGGSPVGELTVREVPGIGTLTVWYVADPEGNIIELQKWSR